MDFLFVKSPHPAPFRSYRGGEGVTDTRHSGFGTNLGPYGQHLNIFNIDYILFLCSPDGIDMSEITFSPFSTFKTTSESQFWKCNHWYEIILF